MSKRLFRPKKLTPRSHSCECGGGATELVRASTAVAHRFRSFFYLYSASRPPRDACPRERVSSLGKADL